MSNKTLGELIAWLESQPANSVVQHGFGPPHSDRGSYCDLAFAPLAEATYGDMLAHAKSALGQTFHGYKGGEFQMGEWTDVLIGSWGLCGENITDAHFLLWKATERTGAPR